MYLNINIYICIKYKHISIISLSLLIQCTYCVQYIRFNIVLTFENTDLSAITFFIISIVTSDYTVDLTCIPPQ